MKNSLLYLGAALAQSLILVLIKKIGGARLSSEQLPYFRIVHEMDGRVRYYSELMKSSEFCRLFDEKLKSLPGITSVRSNHLTGTSLITHSLAKSEIREIFNGLNRDLKEQLISEQHSSVTDSLGVLRFMPRTDKGLKRISAEKDKQFQNLEKLANLPVRYAECSRGNSSVRESFFDNMSAISRNINTHTFGYFDLTSLIGIVLIVRGLYKIVRLGQLPNGPQLVWWGYSLFRTRDLNVRTLSLRSQDSI
jgi:hypothetical protein